MNKKAEVLQKLTTGLGGGSVVVEVGALRFSTEIATDGYSTYYLAQLARERDWLFYSVDSSEKAIKMTQGVLGRAGLLPCENVLLVQADARTWLAAIADEIDFLYLDTGSAITNAQCVEAALSKLIGSVVIDDTNKTPEGEYGEGSLAIPWLQKRGWKIESFPTEMQSDGINPMLMSCLTKEGMPEKATPRTLPKTHKPGREPCGPHEAAPPEEEEYAMYDASKDTDTNL